MSKVILKGVGYYTMKDLFQCVISPKDRYGKPLVLNKTDIRWVDLFNEIDNIQHWMVQQKSRKYLLEKLSQYGWRF